MTRDAVQGRHRAPQLQARNTRQLRRLLVTLTGLVCDEWPARLHIFRDLWGVTGCRWSTQGTRPQRVHDTEKLVSMPIRFDLIEWRDPAAVRSAAVHRIAMPPWLASHRILGRDCPLLPFLDCAPCPNGLDRLPPPRNRADWGSLRCLLSAAGQKLPQLAA